MTDDTSRVFADVHDESLTRPDGRVVAWTRTGANDGVPVLRMRDFGDGGHFAGYRREGELLDEMLARGNDSGGLGSGS